MITRTCEICSTEFECEQIIYGGKEMFKKTKCDACVEASNLEFIQERQDVASKKLQEGWEAICPKLYRETDVARLPDHLSGLIDGWSYGPKGIGFVSEAGKGKTRVAFQILKRSYFNGRTCHAISATKLSILCADQFSDDGQKKWAATQSMEKCRSVDLLLLDDLGKNKMTERSEMELFDILETRTSNCLPTIWTANASGDDLKSMLSPDRGDPILRRLCEFSEIIKA